MWCVGGTRGGGVRVGQCGGHKRVWCGGGVMVWSYFLAFSTCELARANTLSPAALEPDTFSNAFRAALEWDVRNSNSAGLSWGRGKEREGLSMKGRDCYPFHTFSPNFLRAANISAACCV